MKYPEISQKHPSVYMYFDRCHDLSSLLHKDLKELHLKNPHGGALMTLTAKQEIEMCPYLTDLSFTSVGDTKIEPAVCSVLSTAVGIGKLPCLNHLSFSGSGTAIKGHLSKLFSSEWTPLKHLNLYKCELDKNDVNHLAKHHISLFPNILSLVLYFGKINKPETETNTNLSSFASILFDARQKDEMKVDLAVKLLFNSPWPTLTSIFLHDMTEEAYREFSQIMMKGSLPNLTKLGISMWNLARIIPNNLAPLESPSGTILRQIALQQFLFRKEYLSILAGRLFFAQLHELDISHSFGVRGNLSLLLCHPLPELRALILNGCELNSADLRSLANRNGRLPKLMNLDVTGNRDSITTLFHDSCTWNKLLKFKMSHHLTQDPNAERDKKQNNLEPESIAFLHELSISLGRAEVIPLCADKAWNHFTMLTVISDGNSKLLVSLIIVVESGIVPSLRVLRLVNYVNELHLPNPSDGALRLRLRQLNIIV